MSITIETTLRRIVARVFGLGENEILDDSTLEGLGAGILDNISFLIEIEEAFGIEIDDAAWEGCRTFADYLTLVKATYAEVVS